MEEYKNLILGAGLAGLSFAYHSDKKCAIYEKNSKIGGLTRSEKINNFIFDYAPHILYTIDPYASKLIHKLLEGNLHIQNREAYIYHKKYDVYTRFPYQAHLYGLPISDIKDCLTGLVDMLRDDSRPKPENYQEWMYYRFGKGITEQLMIPYAEKIWTVSPSGMNYDWIDYRVPEPDFSVILEGALTDVTKRAGFNKDFWYPVDGGIEALPIALAKGIGEINLSLNKEATQIFPVEKEVEFNGNVKVKYERLISTLPLPVVINLIDDAPSDIKKVAEELDHNSIMCVNLGVNRANISPYHWLYFHEKDFIFHRISFPMNLSSKTTPEGKSSITCEIAYSKHRPLSVDGKEAIIKRTIDDLIKAKILNKEDEILVSDAIPLKYAYVIYDLNHRKNVDIIHSYLQSLEIYPCGRFGEWEYFNMDQSIMSGKQMADKINRQGYKASELDVLCQKGTHATS